MTEVAPPLPRQRPQLRFRFGVFLSVVAAATYACVPFAPTRPATDAPRRRRSIGAATPFLEFHGRADQLGDLATVAATYRVIAVDADPAQEKFTRDQLATLQAGGRNIVLGFVNVGFCDRTQTYWWTAPEGLLPCVSNLPAQIGPRADRPQQVWIDLEDTEHARLIGEFVAPRVADSGVDGFVLDGMDLLDHGPDDAEAPCDKDCVAGGLALLAGLRKEFPDHLFVMQGGLSWIVRGAHVGRTPVAAMVDGVVGEGVYTPSYDGAREADLDEWKKLGTKYVGAGFAVFTQDYVKTCGDTDWARMVDRASASHGFSPAIGLSPVNRGPVCAWRGL